MWFDDTLCASVEQRATKGNTVYLLLTNLKTQTNVSTIRLYTEIV